MSRAHFHLVLSYTEAYYWLSEAVTQRQEFQADARAAEIKGADTTVGGLRAVYAVAQGWGVFTALEGSLPRLVEGGTSDPFTEFRDRWKDPEFRHEAARGAARAADEETNEDRSRKARRRRFRAWADGEEEADDEPFRTHPPLRERLASLAREGDDIRLFLVTPPEESPEIPLGPSELNRLFIEWKDIKSKRRARGGPVQVVSAKGMKAILGLWRRQLGSHPFAAAAAAVIVLSGTVSGVYEGHQHARPGGALVAALAPVPNSDLFPLGPSVSPLAVKLTGYLQSKNESGFLSLAAPAARKAMRSWWANQQAMGFTTGAVVPASAADNGVNVDSAGNGTAVVLAGTHSPFDPADGTFIPPVVPSAGYRIGLHFSSGSGPDAVGEITSWTPLSDAPWDQGTPLTVRKSAHVEVVGGSGDSALVSQTLPLAETAAAYDLAFMSHFDPEPLNDQTGFVVFVAGSASDRNRWFRSGSQPGKQADDADDGAAYVLEGPSDGYFLDMCAQVCFDGVDGGARVVITPYQQAGTHRKKRPARW